MAKIKFYGFVKQTLIDFPGYISSMVFTKGCNFRCPYCHNPQLVVPSEKCNVQYSDGTVYNYLQINKTLIDALVISGGEPTLHKGIIDFIAKVKTLGLKVKLDTNGTNHKLLGELIRYKLIDFVAMDVKTELEYNSYNEIVGHCLSEKMFDEVGKSVELIKSSSVKHEFRTTHIPDFHTEGIIKKVKKLIGRGNNYKVNQFTPAKHMIKPLSYFSGIKEKSTDKVN